MDEVYKSRWPHNENQIKALVAVGFGVNRDRTLDVTTSRGHDGKVARARNAVASIERQLHASKDATDGKSARERRALERRKKTELERLRGLARAAKRVQKAAHSDRADEMLCKVLSPLLLNALARLLSKSALPAVRAMTPQRVRELLLARRADMTWTSGALVPTIEPMLAPADVAHQAERVMLFNAARPRARDVPVKLRTRDPTGEIVPLATAA